MKCYNFRKKRTARCKLLLHLTKIVTFSTFENYFFFVMKVFCCATIFGWFTTDDVMSGAAWGWASFVVQNARGRRRFSAAQIGIMQILKHSSTRMHVITYRMLKIASFKFRNFPKIVRSHPPQAAQLDGLRIGEKVFLRRALGLTADRLTWKSLALS